MGKLGNMGLEAAKAFYQNVLKEIIFLNIIWSLKKNILNY
jgi:hypothetical protein